MRLTARSEYGLLAMIELARRVGEGPASAREISESLSIPPKFLEQLLVSLRKAGLVTAMRGARGGFTLNRPPDAVTVLDVVEALEGPLTPTVCDEDRAAVCGKSGVCAASDVWSKATNALRQVFAGTTLASLAIQQDRLEASESARS